VSLPKEVNEPHRTSGSLGNNNPRILGKKNMKTFPPSPLQDDPLICTYSTPSGGSEPPEQEQQTTKTKKDKKKNTKTKQNKKL
jgi:hypothetical protein